MSIAAMLCGLLGLFCILPVAGSLMGVLFGHVAWHDYRRSNGEKEDRVLALIGLISGWLGVAGWFVTMLFLVLAPGGLFTLPGLSSDDQRHEVARDRLRRIGQATLMYAQDYDGRLPADLAVLVEQRYLPAGELFVVPGSEHAAPDTVADLRQGKGDFVLAAPGLALDTVDERCIILHSRQNAYKNRFLVFLREGSVGSSSGKSVFQVARDNGWKTPPGKE